MSEGETLTASDIMSSGPGPDLHTGQGDCDGQSPEVCNGNGEDTLEMIEEKAIRSAMKKYNGNLSMVAKTLDISRPTLYSKLRKYNI